MAGVILHPERNAEIVRLRRAGVGPREIARRLRISPNAVNGVLVRARLTQEPKGRGHGLPDDVRGLILAASRRDLAVTCATLGVKPNTARSIRYRTRRAA